MDQEIHQLVNQLSKNFIDRGYKLAVAESCTGGGVCQVITDFPGSSAWFDRGFVSYSNQSKIDMLSVNSDTLVKFGAVSVETAIEMVAGCLQNSMADMAVAVTGIAGPGGGTDEKPVGLVFIACGLKGQQIKVEKSQFEGDRQRVRQLSVQKVFQLLNQQFPLIAKSEEQ